MVQRWPDLRGWMRRNLKGSIGDVQTARKESENWTWSRIYTNISQSVGSWMSQHCPLIFEVCYIDCAGMVKRSQLNKAKGSTVKKCLYLKPILQSNLDLTWFISMKKSKLASVWIIHELRYNVSFFTLDLQKQTKTGNSKSRWYNLLKICIS